ncbi:107-domain-containing protein [Xylogone sp. PMI_703]|nr:107-domain-containing protein [Xylogone sp. PMI_703]
MAPLTRSNVALAPYGDGRGRSHPNRREPSWQFVGEPELLSEREASEEPPSSYDEVEMRSRMDETKDGRDRLHGPEDHEDILHPLREAANRVGREVERFAEVLDGYNPLRATNKDEMHELAFGLINMYHGIAIETLNRLREQHASEKRRRDGMRWRKKMRGFKITQDDEDMDTEDLDDGEGSDLEQKTTLEDLERWEQEAQTWDLLGRLIHLRVTGSNNNALELTSKSTRIHRFSSEREVWESFLESDKLAVERKTVLRWLQDTADDSGEDIDVLVQELQQNAERGDIVAHGWLHTKAAIKNRKRMAIWPDNQDSVLPIDDSSHLNSSKTEPLVTQLDPDSKTRQGKKLEVQDEYFERAIWLGCYEMLRRGRSPAEVREWCIERTEVWRAISMSGLPDEKSQTGGENDIRDPASSILWRRMCFALARKGGGDEYERAVYGILSGDVSSVEPVCRTWDDFIFTHYNAMLRAQFDNFIQTHYPQSSMVGNTGNFSVFDAVQFHGDPNTAGKRLIESLKLDPRTKMETVKPMKMLQGVLIADEFQDFIYQQGLALSKFANAEGVSNLIPSTTEQPKDENITKYIALDDHDSLRVLTHILLVFKGLDLDLGGISHQSVVENVIVSYISFLRLAGKEELIPLYCSQLSGARRYATLSRNLIDITDHDQRVTQIKLMRELGLDVQQFVKFQSRYLFSDYPDRNEEYPATGNFKILESRSEGSERKIRKHFLGGDNMNVERIDMLFIRSLEWYLLVDGLWSEVFTIGTMLYLRFFKNMHLTAARLLASRVPSAEIARMKTPAILGQEVELEDLDAENEDDQDLTELLDGLAEQKRLLKKYLYAEAKSYRELESLVILLDNIDSLRSLADAYEEETSPIMKKECRTQFAQAVGPMRSIIQPLLKEWLLSSQQDEREFLLLREAYLPETILAYICTLQYAGGMLTREFLMDCMDLSALIATEGSDLLELFVKTGRMQELVEMFATASKELLIITSDKPGSKSASKRIRAKGWRQDLWNVKA